MTVIGRKYVCERCKAETFVRYIGEKGMDGGWTKIQNFEKPDGWTWEHDIGDLCPSCSKMYKEMIETFKNFETKGE